MSNHLDVVKRWAIASKGEARKAQPHKEFARRLRVALAGKDWSDAELGRRLRPVAKRATVANWTSGKSLPSGPWYVQLPQVLGVTQEELFPPLATRANRIDDGAVPESHGRRPAELEKLLNLVRDALLAALDRALARDHELIETRRGYFILGSAFLRLGHDLENNGVDTTELRHVALELQQRGQP